MYGCIIPQELPRQLLVLSRDEYSSYFTGSVPQICFFVGSLKVLGRLWIGIWSDRSQVFVFWLVINNKLE